MSTGYPAVSRVPPRAAAGLVPAAGVGLVLLVTTTVLAGQPPKFTDVSAAAGLGAVTYETTDGHSLGVNWIDVDKDGWADLFLVNGFGRAAHLYHNERDGTFRDVSSFLPALPDVAMSGSVFADYDNDGDSDIYIYTDSESWLLNGTNDPDGPPNLLLKNLWIENGGRPSRPLFEEVAAAAGVDDLAAEPFGEYPGYRSKTASWLDYDLDGCVDLFVGHLVFGRAGEECNRDRLYRNRCDGTFEDVTAASGVNAGTDPDTYRGALASIGAHLNDDYLPDLYVVNATPSEPGAHRDLIYLNNGDGTFEMLAQEGIGDDCQAGMGIDVADVDHDGSWDVYISDLIDTELDALPLGNVLYMGLGGSALADNSAPAAGAIGDSSWGVNFFDADGDGAEDLFVANMDVAENGPFLYQNEGSGTFTDRTNPSGLPRLSNGRGSAVADYDRDGDLDLAVVNEGGRLQLFRNDTENGNHWLQLRLLGSASNADAIGAVVTVLVGSHSMMRQVKGGSSGHGQDSLVVHFGLGASTVVDQVTVRWPSGLVQTGSNLAADRLLRVLEPAE